MLDDDRIRIGACVAAVLAALFLAARMLGGDGHDAPRQVAVSGSAAAAGHEHEAGTPGARKPAAGLTVHVAGAVQRPGVYRVPAGSRADAAVAMAGGVSRRGDGAAVNLAAPLQDGQQIVVPRRGERAPAPTGGAAPGPSAASSGAQAAGRPGTGAPISLSQATVEQLDTLDGIGPTLAQRIIQYRDSHGGFRSVEELRQVEGIGEKRFEALKAAVQP